MRERRGRLPRGLREDPPMVTHSAYSSFTSCKENENFNSCWKTCKQGTSDGSYLSLSKCYEDMCYLGAARAFMVLGLALLMLFVMW